MMAAQPEIAHDSVDRPRMGMVGMALILAALSMLFIAALLGYLLIRFSGGSRPELHTLALPVGLWFSTGAILISGVTMEWACQSIKSGAVSTFRTALAITLGLAVVFVGIQTPSLMQLLEAHEVGRAQGNTLYGLIFVLILLHAAHVIGGIIPMAVTTVKAFRGAYTADHWAPVRYNAMYWHFLDIVWIVTFSIFVAVG